MTNPLAALKLMAPQSKTAALLQTRERLASLALALRYSGVEQNEREKKKILAHFLFSSLICMKIISIPKLKRRNEAVTIRHDHLKNNTKGILRGCVRRFLL